MSLHTTLQGDRIQIALFGKRNAGKSSVINAVTGQQLAIVSEVKGTTTDPVSKAMELLPLGPCMFIDTPGIDDEGELGEKRVERAMQVLNRTDIALVVIDINTVEEEDLESVRGLPPKEMEIISLIEEKKIPYVIVLNQADRMEDTASEEIRNQIAMKNGTVPAVVVSSKTGDGLEELKDTLIRLAPDADAKLHIVGDLIEEGDIILLVVPVDSAAPKGRLIMPQQQVIRDILDNQAIAIVVQVPQLPKALEDFQDRIKMVITDSQVFKEVSAILPESMLLTSFSILFARHKGYRDGEDTALAEGTYREGFGD